MLKADANLMARGLILAAAALVPDVSRAAEPASCANNLISKGVGHILISGMLFDGTPAKTNQLAADQGQWNIAQFRAAHPHHDVYLLCRYVGVPADIRIVTKLPKNVSSCAARKESVFCQ